MLAVTRRVLIGLVAAGACSAPVAANVYLRPDAATLLRTLYTETSREAVLDAVLLHAGLGSPGVRSECVERLCRPAGSERWASQMLSDASQPVLLRIVAARVVAALQISDEQSSTLGVWGGYGLPHPRDWSAQQLLGTIDSYASGELPHLRVSDPRYLDVFLPGLSAPLGQEASFELHWTLISRLEEMERVAPRDLRLLIPVYVAQTGDPGPLSMLWEASRGLSEMEALQWQYLAVGTAMDSQNAPAVVEFGLACIQEIVFRPPRDVSELGTLSLAVAFLKQQSQDPLVQRFVGRMLRQGNPGRLFPEVETLIGIIAGPPGSPLTSDARGLLERMEETLTQQQAAVNQVLESRAAPR